MLPRIRRLTAPEAGCGHPNNSSNASDGAADWANDDIRCSPAVIIGREASGQLVPEHLAASRQSRGNGPNRAAADLGDFAIAQVVDKKQRNGEPYLSRQGSHRGTDCRGELPALNAFCRVVGVIWHQLRLGSGVRLTAPNNGLLGRARTPTVFVTEYIDHYSIDPRAEC